ncbi:hypothetical protein U472_11920 [Orenia metallireducens]|uniref:HD-GYP domain-containing protein n=1 Tax=Orenia metallireducens TaxID=1413210 RepID=A0A1C0A8W4_9FIRM|nr:HD domain-containing phosphohydrolase [Orenia metallireducens]OCL26675.1 hypothetical protein U472_11920 [Orenia metallireducens]
MKSHIILLSKREETFNLVQDSLYKEEYKLHQISPDELMLKIYQLKPKLLITDIDYYQESTIKVIKILQSQNYLPVIYLYSNPYPKIIDRIIESEIVINKSNIADKLPNLAKQAINFKNNYNKVTASYETIDLINNKVDQLLKEYINNDFIDYGDSIKEILNYVFATNPFLSNKPEIILTIFKEDLQTITDIYIISENKIEKSAFPVALKNKAPFKLSTQLENEFFYNCNEDDLSDIDDYQNVFADEILNRIHKINNFSGYQTTDIALIGINYNKKVTHFDANIIKTLSISFNLIKNIHHQLNEVKNAFIYTINSLSRAAEASDDDTGYHIKRVNEYSKLIAKRLGLDKNFIEEIYYCAQMHDVGKVYIPKHILCKRGKLTDDEFTMIKKHTTYGAEIIGDSPHLKMATDIALNHHERFDGSGYPNGKSGDEIPLSARIVMLADIYDALRSSRPYKPAFSHEKTYDIIVNGDGRVEPSHFDPKIYQLFKKIHHELDTIYNTWNEQSNLKREARA